MGYTSNKKLPGESHLRFLRRTGSYFVGSKWQGPTPGTEYHIIAMHPGRGGVYGVIRVTNSADNTEYQFALVIKFETIRGVTQYKTMTEMDAPAMAHMAEKLFRRLTPVDQLPLLEDDLRHCRDWRARCQKLIDNRNALRPGVRFTASQGIPFGRGARVSDFEVLDLATRMFMANPGTSNAFKVQLTFDIMDELEFTVHA